MKIVPSCVPVLILLLILLFPSASAGPARPPQTLVVDVVGFSNFTDGSYVARVNVTFQVSPDDSQSGTPTMGYMICGSPDLVAGIFGSCTTLNGTLTPIPNHPGWVWTTGFTSDACGPGGFSSACTVLPPKGNYSISVWNGTDQTQGCTIVTDLSSVSQFTNDPSNALAVENSGNLNGPLWFYYGGDSTVSDGRRTYHACGGNATLESPAGVSAIVTTPYGPNITDPSRTTQYWKLSPSDLNQSYGSFDYYYFRSSTNPPQSALVYRGVKDALTAQEVCCGNGTRDNSDAPWTSFDSSNVVNPLFVRVLARDNQTHQQSELSCFVQVQQGQQYSEAACGNITLPLAIIGAGDPAFPLVDIPTYATAFGTTVPLFAAFMGFILLAACVIGGYRVAKGFGATVLGFSGFGAAVSMNLFPVWWIIIAFMVLLLILLTRIARPSGGSA